MNFTRLHSKSFLVPTVLTIVFTVVLLILMGTGERKFEPLWRTLSQWDGQHYLAIADSGYEKFPCPDDPELICGNVGWFPLFPLLARGVGIVLGPFGVDIRWSILITGWVCFWLALMVLYRLLGQRYDAGVAAATLGALLVFPTSFYFLTAFPYALYLLLAVMVFLLIEQQRYFLCALPSGLLAVTYPSGLVIVLPLLWVLVFRWRQLTPRERLGLAGSVAAVGVALLLYGLYYWVRFDDFFLYVHFQSKPYYAHEAAFPLVPIFGSLMSLPDTHPIRLMLLLVLAVTGLFYSRRVPASWQVFMWGVLLFTPSAGTTTSYYRHVVVAFPLYVMVALGIRSSWRRYLVPLYIVVALGLMVAVYLRAYKMGVLM